MSVRLPVWMVCDKGLCLYNEARTKGRERCIKHGAILNYACAYNGMSREQVREAWAKEDVRPVNPSNPEEASK